MLRHDVFTEARHDRHGHPGNGADPFSSVSHLSAGKPTPKYIRYLGRVLPSAVFGLLVVYCLRNVNLLAGSHGIPEFISILLVVLLHLWKRQMLLSIAGGTVCYMLLVQLVF